MIDVERRSCVSLTSDVLDYPILHLFCYKYFIFVIMPDAFVFFNTYDILWVIGSAVVVN